VDGANLYQSVGGSPLSRNDPDGRLLVAIDGTASCAHRASPGFWNSGGCTTSHVLNFFIDYDLTSPALYLDGPDSAYNTIGAAFECSDIEDKAYDFIVKELCENPDEPIDLVGHSRGGYIVMQLAQRLQREGVTCPNGCKIPNPRVRFLGLYDPVDMAPGYGGGEGIPWNVSNSVRLLGAGGRSERGAKGVCHPDAANGVLSVRSRAPFNRADGPPSSSRTNHRDIWIFATHSGVGGAPWCGDKPLGHDPTNDTIQAIRCDRIIRDAARSCGVPVGKKQFCDYGFRVPAGSIPCGGGFLTPGCN
jgi:pimeloyl-ACP methyl ester carboxylesterase